MQFQIHLLNKVYPKKVGSLYWKILYEQVSAFMHYLLRRLEYAAEIVVQGEKDIIFISGPQRLTLNRTEGTVFGPALVLITANVEELGHSVNSFSQLT